MGIDLKVARTYIIAVRPCPRGVSTVQFPICSRLQEATNVPPTSIYHCLRPGCISIGTPAGYRNILETR